MPHPIGSTACSFILHGSLSPSGNHKYRGWPACLLVFPAYGYVPLSSIAFFHFHPVLKLGCRLRILDVASRKVSDSGLTKMTTGRLFPGSLLAVLFYHELTRSLPSTPLQLSASNLMAFFSYPKTSFHAQAIPPRASCSSLAGNLGWKHNLDRITPNALSWCCFSRFAFQVAFAFSVLVYFVFRYAHLALSPFPPPFICANHC